MKILIVEDNEDSRNLLVKQLLAYGHEIAAAADGVEALEQALKETPDIIVSDILMPRMDGYQLCHECKQNDKLKDIPFAFYTATYTSDEDEKFALSLGANTFIRKPTEPDAFVQILSQVFEKAKSGLLPTPQVGLPKTSLYLAEYSKRIVVKMDKKVADLEVEITEHKRAEHDLTERVKELRCLFGLEMIGARPGLTLDELYREVVKILPQSWQYPKITAARLTLYGKRFEAKNYRDTEWKQSSDINVYGVKAVKLRLSI
ncbi:Sensor histidine kinase RcsC [subsurface metagenome]